MEKAVRKPPNSTEFCLEKFPRNILGTVSVFPRKQVLIPRHSEVYRSVNYEARNGMELHEKIRITKYPAPANRIESVLSSAKPLGAEFREFAFIFVPRNGIPRKVSERNSETLKLFLFLSTEFQAFFSSAEWFGMEFREISVPRNSRNSARTNQLFRLFRRPRNNFFCRNLSLPRFYIPNICHLYF